MYTLRIRNLRSVSEHTFDFSLIDKDSVILDLGANKLNFSNWFLDNYDCKVTAVEPNPDLVQKWTTSHQLTAINAAVGHSSESLAFFVGKNNESSSFTPLPDSHLEKTIEVNTKNLEEIMAIAGIEKIDLLKVDIEGSEISLIENTPTQILKSIPQITIEFHDFNGMNSRGEVKKIISTMRHLGFTALKTWIRGHGDVLFLNQRCVRVDILTRLHFLIVIRLGNYIRNKFSTWQEEQPGG